MKDDEDSSMLLSKLSRGKCIEITAMVVLLMTMTGVCIAVVAH